MPGIADTVRLHEVWTHPAREVKNRTNQFGLVPLDIPLAKQEYPATPRRWWYDGRPPTGNYSMIYRQLEFCDLLPS